MLKTDRNLNDLIYILDNLREEDLDEVKAAYGNDWKNKVIETTITTDFLILSNKDIPVAAGGFAKNPYNEKIACVWLLCTQNIKNYKLLLFKELKYRLNKASPEFDIMYNFIYKSNFKSKKWLKKLGFKFDNPHPNGLLSDADFHFFYKINQ